MSDARRVTLKHWPDLWGAQVEYDPNGDWAIIPWEEIERLREELKICQEVQADWKSETHALLTRVQQLEKELLHEMNANEMKGQIIYEDVPAVRKWKSVEELKDEV